MKIHNVEQGSPEWLALRAAFLCASEAPAMMGESRHMSRTELLRIKKSGDAQQFTQWQQENLLNRGHEFERAARILIEADLSVDLYPITGSEEIDGLKLLASFDGLTDAGDVGFEHKGWNEQLAAQVRAGSLEPEYYWQLEQQILIGGLERVIFCCSDGTAEKMERMAYYPVPGRAAQLLAGWKQFTLDLEAYKHIELAPPVAGKVIERLPTLAVQVTGSVTNSNLALYKTSALAFIESINTNLTTDQHFADAENIIKFCSTAEKELEMVKSQAIAQTISIDELFRTIDSLKNAMRDKRLLLDKLVKARKDAIREEIRREGVLVLEAHVQLLTQRLGVNYLPLIQANFANVMKGLKSVESLRDAVNTEVARVKIEMNAVADRIEINLKTLRELADGRMFLFADEATLVVKASVDMVAIVRQRITEHTSKPAAISRKRPAEAEIVDVVAKHYQVDNDTALSWLSDMKFKAKPAGEKRQLELA